MYRSPARITRLWLAPEARLLAEEGRWQEQPLISRQQDLGAGYLSDDASSVLSAGRKAGKRLFATFLRRDRSVESAGANHHYTREERQRLNQVESIDYLPPDSQTYRIWLSRQPYRWVEACLVPACLAALTWQPTNATECSHSHRRYWDRWLMMGAVGLSVGLIGYLLFACIDIIAHVKFRAVRCAPLSAASAYLWPAATARLYR